MNFYPHLINWIWRNGGGRQAVCGYTYTIERYMKRLFTVATSNEKLWYGILKSVDFLNIRTHPMDRSLDLSDTIQAFRQVTTKEDSSDYVCMSCLECKAGTTQHHMHIHVQYKLHFALPSSIHRCFNMKTMIKREETIDVCVLLHSAVSEVSSAHLAPYRIPLAVEFSNSCHFAKTNKSKEEI